MAETILTMPYRMTVYLVSSTLFQGTISSSQAPSAQPSEAVKLKVEVSGEVTSGTLHILGELGGVVQSETMTYDQPRTKTSTKFYDKITSISASAGLIGGSIVAKQVNGGGAEVMTETATKTHNGRVLKCQFSPVGLTSLVYQTYGVEPGSLYYVRTIRYNPLCIAPETEFAVSHPQYRGNRFKPRTDIVMITPPGKRSSPEVYFHAIKVK